MSRHYTINDTDVRVIATMLGCEPASGLVNTMNALSADGSIHGGDTYGQILRAVLLHELARLARKPAEDAAA